jgi:hypothetical protein
MDETDLRILVDIILRINDDANLRMFGNTEFPCDSDIEGGFVVCTEEPLPIESGDVYVFVDESRRRDSLSESRPLLHLFCDR